LEDFSVSASAPTPILLDSAGVIRVARDLVKNELTKHTCVDATFVRTILQGHVLAQSRAQHGFFLSKLSVVDPFFEGEWGVKDV
jgi:hypothetical protein